MRIGIPMKAFDPKWGGPGTYTIELVNRLVRLGGGHEYVLLYPSDVTGRIEPSARSPAVKEVMTDQRRGIVWDQVLLPPLAKREGIDVLFSPFMSIPVLGKFKKVFTIHGAERYVVPGMLRADQYLRWMFMDKVLVRSSDRIIAVSQTMAVEYCKATGCDPAKVRSIPLGVSENFGVVPDRQRLESTRDKFKLPEHFILFVGRIFPNKNFGNLLRAFAKVVGDIPHKLVVAGGVRWKFESDLALVDELGLRDRVQFLDFVKSEELVHLYNLATCFVYPSFYESFGLAQVEAMACGCPVVAANTGALPEIAGDAALFCNPADPSDIAAAIRRLTTDPVFRESQKLKGLARSKLYTWDRCARETLQVLAETVV
ncbi:MAG: glycosyltransferase family 1 protein [Gammaproteobacteria bacterium]